MSNLTDIAARTKRFRDAVRAVPRAPLRLICELPATVGGAVSVATIARFLAEVRRSSTSARQRQRFGLHTNSCSEHNPKVQPAAALPEAVATAANTAQRPCCR